jgi:hypothetical protein
VLAKCSVLHCSCCVRLSVCLFRDARKLPSPLGRLSFACHSLHHTDVQQRAHSKGLAWSSHTLTFYYCYFLACLLDCSAALSLQPTPSPGSRQSTLSCLPDRDRDEPPPICCPSGHFLHGGGALLTLAPSPNRTHRHAQPRLARSLRARRRLHR